MFNFLKGKVNTNKIKMQEKLRKYTEEAQEYFADKSFAQSYLWLRTTCLVLLIPASILSALNAIGLFLAYSMPTAGVIGGTAISSIITILIEVVKTGLFLLAVKEFYKNGFSPSQLFFSALFLGVLSISVITSIMGAEEITKGLDKTQARQDNQTDSLNTNQKTSYKKQLAQAEKDHRAHLANLKTEYGKQIASEQQGLADYKASVSHKGQINIYNATNASTISAYQERISALQQSLLKEIADANTIHKANLEKLTKEEKESLQTIASTHQKKTAQNAKNLDFSVWFWGIVSGINEGAIIFCAWFIIHYRWKIQNEPNELGLMPNVFQEFENFLFMYGKGRQDLPQGLHQNLPQNQQQDLQQILQDLLNNLPQNQQQDLQGLPRQKAGFRIPDLQGLYDAIARGELHTPTLTNKYNVNPNYVNACKVLQGLQITDADKAIATNEYKKLCNFLGVSDATPAPKAPARKIITPDFFTAWEGKGV